jgi:hypothetical protein
MAKALSLTCQFRGIGVTPDEIGLWDMVSVNSLNPTKKFKFYPVLKETAPDPSVIVNGLYKEQPATI